jgi:exodeoxyribonuclease V alpha subunit
MLPQYNLAYAITVHKTQGSEFNNVLLVIPEFKTQDNSSIEIYNNQMLYTAVTRAKHGVTICAGVEQVRYMIDHSYHRI